MKTTDYEFNGRKYYLCFNSAAMFDCFDKFGGEDVTVAIGGTTAQSFINLCWVLQKMSEQGELLRRYFGYDAGETINADELALLLTPTDAVEARGKAIEAISNGFARTENDKAPVDPWLAEIEQKKTEKSHAHNGFMRRVKYFILRLKKLFSCRRD